MKRKIFIKILYVIFIIALIISIAYIINYFYSINKTKSELEVIREIMRIDNDDVSTDAENEEIIESEENNIKIENLKKLKSINSDIVAWIEIEGTEISYPVLQTDNNEYYLTRDYKKEYNSNGSIFLDYRYDLDKPSDNFLIYGHNNNNGLMFNALLEYEDKNYYENHPEINLITAEENVIYKIIVVFKGQAYTQDEEEFQYYNYIDFNTDEEYYSYIENCKKNSLYEIDEEIDYREKLLTLSTCEYSKKNGRFAILAIKVSE